MKKKEDFKMLLQAAENNLAGYELLKQSHRLKCDALDAAKREIVKLKTELQEANSKRVEQKDYKEVQRMRGILERVHAELSSEGFCDY